MKIFFKMSEYLLNLIFDLNLIFYMNLNIFMKITCSYTILLYIHGQKFIYSWAKNHKFIIECTRFHNFEFLFIICLRNINNFDSLKNILPRGRTGRTWKIRGRSVFFEGPKLLLLGAEVSFHEEPKCLDEGPKCLF